MHFCRSSSNYEKLLFHEWYSNYRRFLVVLDRLGYTSFAHGYLRVRRSVLGGHDKLTVFILLLFSGDLKLFVISSPKPIFYPMSKFYQCSVFVYSLHDFNLRFHTLAIVIFLWKWLILCLKYFKIMWKPVFGTRSEVKAEGEEICAIEFYFLISIFIFCRSVLSLLLLKIYVSPSYL
jgi:hypothetical protein